MLLLWLTQPAAVIVIGQVFGSHSMALGSRGSVVACEAASEPADTIIGHDTQQQRSSMDVAVCGRMLYQQCTGTSFGCRQKCG
jgi:hypothetical protein